HTFSSEFIKTLVLDEFDKSLEVGFEKEMKEILSSLYNLEKRILTSATFGVEVPAFVGLTNLTTVDYLKEGGSNLQMVSVPSPSKDKLETLVKLLAHLGEQSGIIFCNFKDSIERVSSFLTENEIPHACFYGGLDQLERERALIKFRNGTHRIIIATDLAARGIDVPELDYILHYQLPPRKEEFTHRNGRTARMNAEGTAYIIHWKEESLSDFIGPTSQMQLADSEPPSSPPWKTVFISGGRKDKISKGDIAGFFMKEGKLNKNELGIIEIKEDCSFAAIAAKKAFQTVKTLNNTRLKTKKVRISFI
ncbi:MAG TPA: helicase-related protein, partial [Vampirovibrionales bacterium]